MRIFLFCVDALEYNYVHFRDYVYLKQNQNYKLEIPENCLTLLDDGTLKPFTPVIWRCIFTGRPISENPTSKPERYKNPLLNWLLDNSVVQNSWKALLNTGLT